MAEQNIPSNEREREFTRINVPYIDRKLSFAYPFAGPNDYRSVAKEILENKTAKMSLPDGEKTAFLLHAVYCGPEEFIKKSESEKLIDEIWNPMYLWIFQRNLWVPKKYNSAHGVFVVYDKNGIGTSEELDIGELERALKGGRKLKKDIRFSEDGKIGFAPRNTYREGVFKNPEDFANDGFIIASNKEDGARNLAEVSQSEHFKYKQPRSWILNAEDKPIQTVSAVGYRGWDDYRLGFGGNFPDGYWDGCASGVWPGCKVRRGGRSSICYRLVAPV